MDDFIITEVTIQQQNSNDLHDELISLSELMKDLSKKIENHKPDLQYTKKASEMKMSSNIVIEWAEYILNDN